MAVKTTTKLPRTRETLVHPIAFFDQRSHFFRLRQLIDDEGLIRQYFGQLLEEQCGYVNDVIKAELRGLTNGAPLYWDEGKQDFTSDAGRKKTDPIELLTAAAGQREAHVLLLDPVTPLERLDASPTKPVRVDYPQLVGGRNARFRVRGEFDCDIECASIVPNCWNMLVFISRAKLDRLRAAVGPVPDSQDFDQDEWLLRHAFADKNVRENGELASVLSRLPILFAETSEPGRVRFEFEGIPKGGDYGIPGNHWLVGVIDSEAYLRRRH